MFRKRRLLQVVRAGHLPLPISTEIIVPILPAFALGEVTPLLLTTGFNFSSPQPGGNLFKLSDLLVVFRLRRAMSTEIMLLI
jgi:hypothetical protein